MRLDLYLVKEFNLTRSRASDLIKLGSVKVNDKVILKPSYKVSLNDEVILIKSLKYVSRSGNKLEEAIKHFNLDFNNKTVLDVGSSTGGFTDCSLKHGASIVYAYDVGTNQMDEHLKKNDKVHLFEQTNILDADPQNADICLMDVSFTSIKPIIKHLVNKADLFIMLFKPQFEVGKKHIKGGIVKDQKVINKQIDSFKDYLKELNINLIGYIKINLKGKKGNQEYIFLGDANVTTNKN